TDEAVGPIGEAFDREGGGVDRAPDDEGPVRAVPDGAGHHRDPHVDHGACGAVAAAAERVVDVVAEPGGEGDVPATPQGAHGAGVVWVVEVEGELDAHPLAEADGDVGVAAEVAVNLDAEEEGDEPPRRGGGGGDVLRED